MNQSVYVIFNHLSPPALVGVDAAHLDEARGLDQLPGTLVSCSLECSKPCGYMPRDVRIYLYSKSIDRETSIIGVHPCGMLGHVLVGTSWDICLHVDCV